MKLNKTYPLIFLTLFLFACGSSVEEKLNSDSHSKIDQEANVNENLPATQAQTSNKIQPVDEGQFRPDLNRFREEIIAAIDRKDVSFILQIVDDHIQIGYSADNGKDAFVKKFDLKENPAKSDLWKELKKVLQMGGVFDRREKNGFMAPYISATWPEGLEPLEYLVVTGKEIEVRVSPGWNEKVIATLSHDIVARVPGNQKETLGELEGEKWPWVFIEMPDKTRGYIYGKYVHGPTDYRAYFKQKGAKWKLVSFVEGD